ncbi:MAG: VWA domain-containing protein [Coriobacteriia bacterium]|nr:VWA domain-containing protein [Coriobacteriia bacterium]
MAVIVGAPGGQSFPFSAIVGQETLKLALLLNAVDPRVGGVLIRGEKGTAKSTAVRALRSLLPPITIVSGCRFACDPADAPSWCDECCERSGAGPLPTEQAAARLVELPVSATEDRIVGTLDFEHAIKRGEKRFEPGLLANANRAILYVDEVNLLDDHLVDTLLDAAAMGVNSVEREGVSFRHPARFMLIGTMNPEEGELRPQLLDRFGLCVDVSGVQDPGARVEIVRRRRDFDANPVAFCARWADDEAELTASIERGRALLPSVTVSDELLLAIANLALSVGVDGHRADQAMARAAAALAALEGREVPTVSDVSRIAPLVLAHRVRRTLFDEPRIDSVAMAALIATSLGSDNDQADDEQNAIADDTMLSAGQAAIWETAPDPRQPVDEPSPRARIAIPDERENRVDYMRSEGRRRQAVSAESRGRHTGSRASAEGTERADIALEATLRAAAPNQSSRNAANGLALQIERSEIQQKVRRHKAGTTIVFCVDTSSSMGTAARVAAVRTAVVDLLHDAYRRRDRVAVVAFRGDSAEVLLAPTASIQLAEMRLRDLTTGGSTPLAAGLLTSMEVVEREQRRDPDVVGWIVVLSDGRANVGLSGGVGSADALAAAVRMKAAGVHALVVDVAGSDQPSGPAREIATAAGARYVKTGDGGHTLAASVRSVVHNA